MLTQAENELMCRVGPGTGMGATMRRYWLPALASSELPEPGGDPVHVELLGEHFVAFRDAEGKVGLLDETCCHRGASLLLGRVEGCGIRCIYHGWKFAVDGKVLDTPNVADEKFKDRIRARAYPVREAGGLVWTYLGPADLQPPLPEWPWMTVEPSHRINAMAMVTCNYVQMMEGLVDSSHLSVLHITPLSQAGKSELDFARKTEQMAFDAAPRIEAELTDFGFHYVALRDIASAEGRRIEARVAAFIPPCFIANPNGDLFFAVVPVNDVTTRFYHVWWNPERNIGEEPLRSEQLKFVGLDDDALARHGMTPATADTALRPSRENRWHQNRQLVRTGHFTGIHSFTQEDVAVTVSGGAIRDRSKEMLSVADLAIGRLYRVLLNTVKRVANGDPPTAVDANTRAIRGVSAVLSPGVHWRTLVPGHLVHRGADATESVP
ncbi:MAG: Rieske (2Fe-2S) domain protein [Gammaproteobacteria bacterium]|nr:Rieske (2Fe-2S) domain protein [Gammaproteobacteria bacterium]